MMASHTFRGGHSNLRIAQLNMQGAKIVGTEIRERVDSENIDILCMQEPHSKSGRITGMSALAVIASGCSSDPKTAISFHNPNLEAVRLSQYCSSHCTLVQVQSGAGSFYIISLYAQYSEPIDHHLNKLEEIFGFISSKQENVIITGDFNARSVLWHDRLTDDNGRKVEDFVSRNNLYILNEHGNPHTFSSNGTSNIDLTIVNGSLLSKIRGWRVIDGWTSSDHRVITFELCYKLDPPEVHPSSKIPRFHLRHADWELFARQLVGSWDKISDASEIKSIDDIDERVRVISNELTTVCNSSIPKQRSSRKTINWWQTHLTLLKSTMHKRRRAYQSEKNQEAKEYKLSIFRAARNKYFFEVHKAKQTSFERYITEYGNRDPWGLVYKYNAGKLRPRETISTIRSENGVTTETWHETRVELLNTLLPDETPDETESQRAIREIANLYSSTEANDPPFTWVEVTDALKSFKRNKSPGIDNLNAEIIRMAWPIIGTSLVVLLNSCLKFGYFPTSWKIGELIVIRKPGDKDPLLAKSYRPIMLLPVMGKLLEKLLAGRIVPRIDSNIRFTESRQFGFRRGKSTEDAIVCLVNKIKRQTSKYVMGLFLDISGAFDNLTWPSVMASLSVYNLPNNIINIMRSYFSRRVATIRDKHSSVTKCVSKGCPQGSILGPLIWNVVFNTSMMDEFDEVAFADDKVILINGNSRLDLQRQGQLATNKMQKWCNTHKMSLSAEKTVLLQLKGKFDSRRPPTISLNGRNLKMVKTVRYLGVDLDERLGVTSHVLRVCENAKKLFHSLARVSREGWGLRHDTSVVIYKGVAEALFTYAAAGWSDRLNCHHIRSLESAQRNILLRITRAYRTTSKEAVAVLGGVLPVDLLIKKRVQMYNMRRNLAIELGVFVQPADSDRCHKVTKTALEASAIDLWQRRWNESDKGRHTFSFIPDIRKRLASKLSLTSAMTQVITGHGKFKAYLRRFNIQHEQECTCGFEVEDVNHLLYYCDEEDIVTLRQMLDNVNGFTELSKPKLLDNEALPKFQHYCAELIRLLETRNSDR